MIVLEQRHLEFIRREEKAMHHYFQIPFFLRTRHEKLHAPSWSSTMLNEMSGLFVILIYWDDMYTRLISSFNVQWACLDFCVCPLADLLCHGLRLVGMTLRCDTSCSSYSLPSLVISISSVYALQTVGLFFEPIR
jgi:hypothetical protein